MCRTTAERALAAELDAVRPDSATAYAAGLQGARSAVLTRLWRGLVHEPFPWVTGRSTGREGVTLRLADGRRLRGPHADPWATGASVTELELDGRPFDHPAELVAALGVPEGGRLAAELDHSVASMALSRTTPRRPLAVPGATSWAWEQAETDGHPYHPCCRSRPGFSAVEQLAYAPEHRPVVPLRLAEVEDAAVSGAWPAALRDGSSVLIPVHPWQAAHVLSGLRLRPGPDAHPLLSLRTLALGDEGEALMAAGGASWAPGGEYARVGRSGEYGAGEHAHVHAAGAYARVGGSGDTHVKTSLSTRLTSTVRDISAYTVTHAVATSVFAEGIAERFEGRLHIARTLAAAGAGTADLAVLLREAPQVHARGEAGESVVPVAVLPALLASRTPGERLDRVAAFARLALGVCLELLDLGVALEAHGQNLLVVVDAECRPLRLVYRDLADIRISPARLARHGIAAPPLNGRLLNDDPGTLRRKVLGSLVTGALGPLAGDAPTLGAILEKAIPELAPTPDLHALRTRPLPAKALTLMRLDPAGAELWTGLPNPLAAGEGRAGFPDTRVGP
ncbi:MULTISPECIES: IucA/IucC family siderophore biosynthesis protein [unclassified Streptomyces]|uniref:IucA/IucC family siderophore biosynthesis protein n=1 Tax=unclassified Streptomyces TaxID=2593676 RepID=UPI0016605D6E|nr:MULTISPECIES: IucA/IucC family siderophore biosynthesis protein [unclassified Streptomyces]MBD0707751.1 iron transporter [Streptomyces sp. CBMA291]MBD0714914.1 iron transporter [Streptomyces sp. CBMA370]